MTGVTAPTLAARYRHAIEGTDQAAALAARVQKFGSLRSAEFVRSSASDPKLDMVRACGRPFLRFARPRCGAAPNESSG